MSQAKPLYRLVLIALFAALFVLLSTIQIDLGFSPVPITLQGLGIALAGLFLGGSGGFLSILLVCALTALGIPLLHGQGGLPIILGPTGGFIWMFPVSALLIGFFSGKVLRSRLSQNRILMFLVLFLILEVFGSFLAYVSGVPWLMHKAGYSLNKGLALGCYPYLPGDAVKSFIAAGIALAMQRYLPALQVYRAGGTKIHGFDTANKGT